MDISDNRDKRVDQIYNRNVAEVARHIFDREVGCLRTLLREIRNVCSPMSCDFLILSHDRQHTGLGLCKCGLVLESVYEDRLEGLNGITAERITSLVKVKSICDDNCRMSVSPINDDPRVVLCETPELTHHLLPHAVFDHGVKGCWLALLSPIHQGPVIDSEKRKRYVYPMAHIVDVWISWLHLERSRLREFCRSVTLRGEAGTTSDIDEIDHGFRSLIRILSLGEIIGYANARLLLQSTSQNNAIHAPHEHFSSEATAFDKICKWNLEQFITEAIGSISTQTNWHNCLRGAWPPCHNGAHADREMAAILLRFCPWTSNARENCNPDKLPEGFSKDQFQKTICERLWGWERGRKPKGKGKYVGGLTPGRFNENALARLFAAETAASGVLKPYFDPKNTWISDVERGHALSSTGRVLHHLLAGTTQDWRTIESLVWMISEYGHKHLQIDARLDLTSHLLQAARAEPALHAMQAYYRDHFFHAIEVCFLGHLLLLSENKATGNRNHLAMGLFAGILNDRRMGALAGSLAGQQVSAPNWMSWRAVLMASTLAWS